MIHQGCFAVKLIPLRARVFGEQGLQLRMFWLRVLVSERSGCGTFRGFGIPAVPARDGGLSGVGSARGVARGCVGEVPGRVGNAGFPGLGELVRYPAGFNGPCLLLQGEVPSGLIGKGSFRLKREHRGWSYLGCLFKPGNRCRRGVFALRCRGRVRLFLDRDNLLGDGRFGAGCEDGDLRSRHGNDHGHRDHETRCHTTDEGEELRAQPLPAYPDHFPDAFP